MSQSPSSIRPPRRLPSLSALRAFEAAANHLSFQQAARELFVTPAAISHQVRSLESALGQPLFRRLTRQLVLTQAGARLLQDLARSFDAMEAGVRALREPAGAGATVTLTTHTAFAAKWVLPRMATLADACPGVRLRLEASGAVADLARGEADLAIRHGRGDWPGLVVTPLMAERYAPVCSPQLRLERAQDLARHPLIHLDWQSHARAPALWDRWFREAGVPAAEAAEAAARPALSFSDETHAIAAALAGHGVALLSLTLVAEELRSGALVQPFGPALDTGGYYVAIARGRETEPAVRAVRDWITTQARTATPRRPSP